MAPGLGDSLRRLFGGGASGGAEQKTEEAVAYKGYMIRPAPQREGSRWLTAGVITKDFDGTVKEHRYIRSDIYGDRQTAVEFSLTKGQQIVDLEGDRIFD